MAAIDPRKFTIKPCNDRVAIQQQRQKTAFDALKNVTRLDVQSRILDGLRTLVRTHSILDGKGKPVIEDAVNRIFEVTGVTNPRAVNLLNKIEFDQLNQMMSRIEGFAERLTQGNVTFDDIPGIVNDLLTIEETAQKIVPEPPPVVCKAPNYAEDLLRYGAKFKTFFMVNFDFYPQYQQLMRDQTFSFLIKRMERPTFVVDHEEVNFYNYRVRVPKRTFFNPVTIDFYDDDKNKTFEFAQNMIQILRPMANIPVNTPFELEEKGGDLTRRDFAGVDGLVNQNGVKVSQYVGTVGPIAEDKRHILRSIIVVQIYDGGTKFNEFYLFRPLIEQITMDELTVDDTSPPVISVQVGFTNLYLRTGVPITELSTAIDQPLPTKFENYASYEQAFEAANPGEYQVDEETVDEFFANQDNQQTQFPIQPFDPIKDQDKLDLFKQLISP